MVVGVHGRTACWHLQVRSERSTTAAGSSGFSQSDKAASRLTTERAGRPSWRLPLNGLLAVLDRTVRVVFCAVREATWVSVEARCGAALLCVLGDGMGHRRGSWGPAMREGGCWAGSLYQKTERAPACAKLCIAHRTCCIVGGLVSGWQHCQRVIEQLPIHQPFAAVEAILKFRSKSKNVSADCFNSLGKSSKGLGFLVP